MLGKISFQNAKGSPNSSLSLPKSRISIAIIKPYGMDVNLNCIWPWKISETFPVRKWAYLILAACRSAKTLSRQVDLHYQEEDGAKKKAFYENLVKCVCVSAHVKIKTKIGS